MKLHYILFLAWFVMFALWIGREFKQYNRRKDAERG